MNDENIGNNETRFTMRMDNDLYKRLKESAIKNKRSIAKELEYITECYFNDESDQINKTIEKAWKKFKTEIFPEKCK